MIVLGFNDYFHEDTIYITFEHSSLRKYIIWSFMEYECLNFYVFSIIHEKHMIFYL